jgi:hypothetical protein
VTPPSFKVPLIQETVTIPPKKSKVVGSNWLKLAQIGSIGRRRGPHDAPATLADSPLESTHAPFGPLNGLERVFRPITLLGRFLPEPALYKEPDFCL